MSKLFTRGRSDLIYFLVLMLENIFPEGSQSRTISINAQYQVLFRNPRDILQISILARQLCPLNSKSFLEIYKRASHRAYGYLFCCFTQSCPDEIRCHIEKHVVFLGMLQRGELLRSGLLRKARPEELKAISELCLNMKEGNLTMPKRNPHHTIVTTLANRNISLSNKKRWMLEYNKIPYNIISPALKEWNRKFRRI